MGRTSRTLSFGTSIGLMMIVALAGLLLSFQAIVKGSGNETASAAQSQNNLNLGDHFIFSNSSLKGTYAGVLDCTLVAGPAAGPPLSEPEPLPGPEPRWFAPKIART